MQVHLDAQRYLRNRQNHLVPNFVCPTEGAAYTAIISAFRGSWIIASLVLRTASAI